ncbi:regulatory protein suaprga1 [Mycena albidolilacea]|uniref:Regulatory protein suaprga1 n=1 Tax=Mycena albidolilacea TaxID=1033008 RepID=A0AAD7EBC1_9AGAR|nr:regulatory protein suaprga1 [Mycena albidolilacea]
MSALRTVRQLTKLRPALRAPPLALREPLASSSSATTLLAQKLRAEISYEAEVQQDDVQEGGWEIKDTPANDEVFLTRKFGDKSIRVMFSIADLQSIPDEDEPEPEAMDDEGPTRGRATTHPGALHTDLYCADSAFDVANVAYYKDARVATELSIASDWEQRTLWTGPLFESLDPALNDAFEAYFRERGVDGALARFVPRYALWKEQRNT